MHGMLYAMIGNKRSYLRLLLGRSILRLPISLLPLVQQAHALSPVMKVALVGGTTLATSFFFRVHTLILKDPI